MIRFIKQNIILCLFVLILLMMGLYYFWLNRMPYTANAFVVAKVRPVSALVDGPITQIHVQNNQAVKKGDPLFTVYTEPYELAVQVASQSVTAAECEIAAIKEEINKNQALVQQQEAQKDYAQYRAQVENELDDQKMAAEVQVKELQKEAKVNKAALQGAKAALAESMQQMQQALAKEKSLKADLSLKKIRLNQTTVYAQNDGIVCNLFIAEGMNVAAGQQIFAFVETGKWWVQANYKETVLTYVKPGMEALIKFPMYPGKVFTGTVETLGWSVNRQETAHNGLPVVKKENEWFLLPQRFPVQISMDETSPEFPLHVGQSANVQIQTGRWQWPSLR